MSFTNDDVIDALGNLTVVELIALTKKLEAQWGLKALPQVVAPSSSFCDGCKQMIHGPHACPGNNSAQTEFNVTLVSFPADKKIAMIKLVREVMGLTLVEAKTLVETMPKMIKEGISKEDAEALKAKLVEVGATVEVK